MDKPGSLEGVRCVTAVVDLPAAVPTRSASTTTFLQRQEDGEAAIQEISAALYEMFDRLSRSSGLGRVISETLAGRQTSVPIRSSNVSRRRMSRTCPSSTMTSAGRGRML